MSDLLTALDKALQNTEPDPYPLTSEVWRRLRGSAADRRHLPPEILQDGKVVEVTAQTVEAIAYGNQICPPETFQQLADLEAAMNAIVEKSKPFSLSRVADHVFRQRDTLHAAMEAGEDVSKLTVDSREHVALEFRTKLAGFETMLRKITHEQVVPLCAPILSRFQEAVEQFMREREESDRALCAGYGLEYHPCLLWKAAAAVAQKYEPASRLPKTWAWALPSSILAGVVTFNQ